MLAVGMRAAEVTLTSEQRATLHSWLRAGKTEQRLAFRAQIILALDEGLSNQAVAERLATVDCFLICLTPRC